MASASDRSICFTCNKERLYYLCPGCSKRFCLDDLLKHRKDLGQQLDYLRNEYNQLRQNLIDQRETNQQSREKWTNYSNEFLLAIETRLNDLAEQIRDMSKENEFNERDLNNLGKKLQILRKELYRATHIFIEEYLTALTDQRSLHFPIHRGNE